MNILVCVKPVPEGIPNLIIANGEIKYGNTPLFLNLWDEYAIEAAIRMKEKYQAKVIALCQGQDNAVNILRRVLAFGCDEAILLKKPIEDGLTPVQSNAYNIAQAIKYLGNIDVVFVGRQAIDSNNGIFGIQLARILVWKILSLVTEISSLNEKNITVIQNLGNINRKVSTMLPIVISIEKGFGELRDPHYKSIRAAERITIPILDESNLGNYRIDNLVNYLSLKTLDYEQTNCEFINGITAMEKGRALIDKLVERGVITR